MNWLYRSLMVAFISAGASASCGASTILYEVSNLAGTVWEYRYAVSNDSLGVDIEEFTIFGFDPALYRNLSLGGAPAGWDPIAIQPDTNLNLDGFYDALALAGGISPGATLGDFTVQFDFLGTGTPGPQAFDIVDPISFSRLDSGTTRPADAVSVPEPGTLGLVVMGLVAAGGVVRKNYT